MLNTKITIITDIQTKPRPRATNIGGFARVYTPKTALTYERYIASEYQRLKGEFYGDTPLYVGITFWFKLPKNTPKYKIKAVKGFRNGDIEAQIPCTTHKDLDNLAKSVLDALNTIAYNDDKQITILQVAKHWTNEQECIDINIYPIQYPNQEYIDRKYK